MKKIFTLIGIIAVIGLAFFACDNGGGDKHTHDWQWVVTQASTVTAEGIETETCSICGETRGTRPIAKLPPQEIKWEFSITLSGYENKPIKVIDTRTGTDDKDLEELGIITRLTGGLNGVTTPSLAIAVDKGLVIVVEETIEYTRFKAYSGNRLGANFAHVSSVDDGQDGARMNSQFDWMSISKPDPIE